MAIVTSQELVIRDTSALRFPLELGQADSPVNVQPYVIFGAYQRRSQLHSFRGTDPQIFAATPDNIEYVVLPLPSSAMTMRQDVSYDGVSLGDIPAAAAGISDVVKGALKWNPAQVFSGGKFNPPSQTVSGARSLGEQSIFAGVGGLAEATGLGDESFHAGEAFLGVARNPYAEVMFKNVEFRSQSFQWTLVPKSLKESQTIDSILQRFKYYQLPGFKSLTGDERVAQSGFLLSYPYQFDIRFSVEATTYRMMPSVLTSLEINYGGQDQTPMFYRGTLNYPSRIGLTMTFQEVVFLVRSDIQVDQYVKEATASGTKSQYRF